MKFRKYVLWGVITISIVVLLLIVLLELNLKFSDVSDKNVTNIQVEILKKSDIRNFKISEINGSTYVRLTITVKPNVGGVFTGELNINYNGKLRAVLRTPDFEKSVPVVYIIPIRHDVSSHYYSEPYLLKDKLKVTWDSLSVR